MGTTAPECDISARLRMREQEVTTTSQTGRSHGGAAWRGTDGYTHIRPIRTTGNRPPLICFFPGEPGARPLANALPKDQPVYEFRELNMDGTSVFPTIEELAETFLKDVRKIQPHGPYQLCGYSSFGLVSYEMARMLLAQGENVSFLGLFDIWHPRFRQVLSSREMVRFRATRFVVRTQKYVRFISQRRYGALWASVREFIAKRAKRVSWRTVRALYRKANRAVPKAMQPLESVASRRSYTPLPYPGKIVLFRPNDLFARTLRDQTSGWRQSVSGDIDVHFVRGDHGSMVQEPYISDLASKIEPYLVRASESNQTS